MRMLLVLLLAAVNSLNSVPVPTKPQLDWTRDEIAALIHFNMATFVRNGDPACDKNNWNDPPYSSRPGTFNPVKLNVSNWLESIHALGAKHTILTAKHGCGFLLWPTATKLPNGKPYGYNVGAAGAFARNVLREYVNTMEAAAIGHGFYYSTGNNFYCNIVNFKPDLPKPLPGQAVVNMEEYSNLVISHLTELWSEYGNLTEIWFDHGYGAQFKPKVIKLLKQYQPIAVAFNGYGVSPNPAKWVGTESGEPKYPIWSTGTSDRGSPTSDVFNPTNADTTLQDYDTWFYVPGTPVRDLKTLIKVYHDSVGQNCLLELDFAIDRTGNVHPTHATQYKALGDWIRSCYGTPLAAVHNSHTNTVVLNLKQEETFDRIIIQEDQQYGQRIRNYTIDSSSDDGKHWEVMGMGSSVGNKRIQLFTITKGTTVRINVTASDGTPYISTFAAFKPCASE